MTPSVKTTWRTPTVRTIELTQEEWVVFDDLGGLDYLRSKIAKARRNGIARRQRNNRMKADRDNGLSDFEICEKYGVSRTTLWRSIT